MIVHSAVSERFGLVWQDDRVCCELLSQDAPDLVRTFLESLPVLTFAISAKFVGDELIVELPFTHCGIENDKQSIEVGDIGYFPGRQHMCVFFGPNEPWPAHNIGAMSTFGRVGDGLGVLREWAATALRLGSTPLRVVRP